MAFNRPTIGQLISTGEAEINALIPNADARLRFGIFNVFARVWAALTDGLYNALLFLSKQVMPTTATGIYLEQIAESYGIYRLPEQSAQGCIRLIGVSGTAVNIGEVFQRADGIEYETTAGVIIPISGEIDVVCMALVNGQDGNAQAGVSLTNVSPIVGLDSAEVCTAGITGGADIESDDSLRNRLLLRLRNPPGAGTITDWETWALSFSSAVTRVWVLPTVYGNGSVGIVFAQDNDGIVPSPLAVAQMQAYLDDFKPVGSTVYVFAPTLLPVNFTIAELPAGDPAIRQSISDELESLLSREAAPGKQIPISHITEAISGAAGEYDHTLVSPAAPLSFAATAPIFEIGVLGAIAWV